MKLLIGLWGLGQGSQLGLAVQGVGVGASGVQILQLRGGGLAEGNLKMLKEWFPIHGLGLGLRVQGTDFSRKVSSNLALIGVSKQGPG